MECTHSRASTKARIHIALMLVVSAAVSFAILAPLSGTTFSAVLVAGFLVHEAGHALALESLGQHARLAIVLPLGGFVKVEGESPLAGADQIRFVLAGPIAGLAWSALAGAIACWLGSVHAGEAAALTAVLNTANLLPGHPLDGGLVVRELIRNRYYGDQTAIMTATTVLTAIIVGCTFNVVFAVIIGLVGGYHLLIMHDV